MDAGASLGRASVTSAILFTRCNQPTRELPDYIWICGCPGVPAGEREDGKRYYKRRISGPPPMNEWIDSPAQTPWTRPLISPISKARTGIFPLSKEVVLFPHSRYGICLLQLLPTRTRRRSRYRCPDACLGFLRLELRASACIGLSRYPRSSPPQAND